MDLHREYGPLVMFKAGARRFVWVNDGSLVRKMYRQSHFAKRPVKLLTFMDYLTQGVPNGEQSDQSTLINSVSSETNSASWTA